VAPPRKHMLIFAVLIVIFELIAAWLVGLDRPAWEDEAHFYRTVRLFGSNPSLTTLRTYPEMSTPVPFAAYAVWGRLFGYELSHLRTLSILFGLLTYLIFFQLLSRLVSDLRLVWFGAILLVLEPYMIGFTMFVYTDISAILFGTLALFGLARRSAWITCAGLALAVLCRQYMAFLTVTAFIFFACEWFANKKPDTLRQLAAVVLSAIPFAALVLFWGGTSPDNTLRQQFLGDGVRFHPEMLSLYIACLFVYLLPLFALSARRFYTNWKVLALSVIGVGFIVFFPIKVSAPLAILGVSRVGQFHRILKIVLGNEFLIHMGFAVCFLFALPMVLYLTRDLFTRIREMRIDFRFLLGLSVAVFLVMMPFSYLGWEKYLMPVIPGAIVYLILVFDSERRPAVSVVSR